MQREVGRFQAVGDDGRKYTVVIHADILDAATAEDPNAVEEGIRSLRTVQGQAVNRLEKGKYRILLSGVTLKSDDANAP